MWVYHQSSGRLTRDDVEIAVGYSGIGEGKNNPALQGVHDVGPIPRGFWSLGPVQCVTTSGPHGPFVIPLLPNAGTNTHGREGFLIHGDSVQHPGSASHGCIILPRAIREEMVAVHDPDLEIVA